MMQNANASFSTFNYVVMTTFFCKVMFHVQVIQDFHESRFMNKTYLEV